jgi:hypothetical protein
MNFNICFKFDIYELIFILIFYIKISLLLFLNLYIYFKINKNIKAQKNKTNI